MKQGNILIKSINYNKHPIGLWVISVSSAFFCFGFAAINASLVLYITTKFSMSVSQSYLLLACYNSLLFATPLLGGYLAERFGYTRTVIIGPILSIFGLLCISIGTLQLLYIGLALFATGVCYFVPTMYVLVGKLYKKEDIRRDSGFTLQYIIMNLGFLFGSFLSGYLHIWFNYRIAFLIAGAINCIGLLVYLSAKKLIIPERGRVVSATHHWPTNLCWLTLIIAAVIIAGVSSFILRYPQKYNFILFFITVVVTTLITISAFNRSNVAKMKLIAFILLSYFSIGFWALYSLEPSLLTVFIKNNVNRHIFGSIIPAQSFYALDSLFIILFGYGLSRIWLNLGKKNLEPSLPFKFFLSLLLMACGFFVLAGGISLNPHGLSSPIIIVLCYVLLSIAELCISPIGNAMVGRLAPEGMEGRLMGVWQLFTGVAGAISGLLAQLAVAPEHSNNLHATNLVYHSAFIKIGGIALMIALLSLILKPFLQKMINSHHASTG